MYKRWEKGDRQGRLVFCISGFCENVEVYVIGWFWSFAFLVFTSNWSRGRSLRLVIRDKEMVQVVGNSCLMYSFD